ncbi:hypothetical protein [Alkalicoccus luteus]|uniref:Uncharacterized protein n=1 Tax=Alkalicoccus luteus TaxID=1237094 RepID=A0A969PUT5_9BACI|nr:hypothetical protein [Alkalicoccus luteus]NJP37909.1 hypothetical protein [Alkalicoccus luteus]
MDKLEDQILELIKEIDSKEALEAISKVVREFGLDVAANLIENCHEPSLLKFNDYEEKWYSEGNEEQGHVRLDEILEEFEMILKLDKSEPLIFFDKNLVRYMTDEEIDEQGRDKTIVWFCRDEEKITEDIFIGFSI